MPDTVPPTPPKLVWPKYALAFVVLFFTLCIVWTAREANRLKRAREEGMKVRPAAQSTNGVAR
jgi:hypothetical protein